MSRRKIFIAFDKERSETIVAFFVVQNVPSMRRLRNIQLKTAINVKSKSKKCEMKKLAINLSAKIVNGF
jgi:hypothetical protein